VIANSKHILYSVRSLYLIPVAEMNNSLLFCANQIFNQSLDKVWSSQVTCFTPVIPALGMLRQKDGKFKGTWGYKVGCRPASATQYNSVSLTYIHIYIYIHTHTHTHTHTKLKFFMRQSHFRKISIRNASSPLQ
jgi:hypothetical protein